MVKRPMMWFVISFIVGICFAAYTHFLFQVICFFILLLIGFALYKKCLWQGFLIIPIFFLVGIIYLSSYNGLYERQQNSIGEGSCTVIGEVKHISSYKSQHQKAIFDLQYINNQSVKGPFTTGVVYIRNMTLETGVVYELQGKVLEPALPRNPGSYNEYSSYKAKGYSYKFYADRGKVIKRKGGLYTLKRCVIAKVTWALDALYPGEEAAVIKTMFLGSRYEEGDIYYNNFKTLGIIHVLAISGLHLALVFTGSFYLFSKLKVGEVLAYVITLVIVLLFAWLTGWSSSTIRAFIMFSILVLGQVVGHKGDLLNSLSLAALCMLVIQPFSLFQPGFQLSFMALLGITFFTPLSKKVGNRAWIIEMLLASLGAFLFTAPVLVYHFYYISLYGLLMNLIMVPILSILMILSLIGVLISFIWLPAGQFAVGLVYSSLKGISEIAGVLKELAFGHVLIGSPNWGEITCFYGLIGLSLYMYKNWHDKGKHLVVPAILLCFVLIFPWPKNNQVVFLDVGQGDCAIIHSGNSHFIIDTGPPKAKDIISDYLAYKGIREVEGIWISHSDRDHMGSLMDLIKEDITNRIFYTGQEEQQNDSLVALLDYCEDKDDITMIPFGKGARIDKKDFSMIALAPENGIDYPNNNESSMVLSVQVDEVTFLFTGDIEGNTEKNLLKNGIETYDILKVGHHGSRTSSTQEFLDQIQPSFGIISCGQNNSYGHPHKDVVKRLEKDGVVLYNTSTDGAIILEINDSYMNIKNWQRLGYGWFKKTDTRW